MHFFRSGEICRVQSYQFQLVNGNAIFTTFSLQNRGQMQKCSGINSFGFIPQSTDQGAVKSRGVCCLKPIEITYHTVPKTA